MPRRPAGVFRRWYRAAGRLFRSAMRWPANGGGHVGWRLLLPGSQYDYEAAAGDLWRNAAIAAALRWLKVNFPEPTVEVVKSNAAGEWEVQRGHAAAELIDNPNRFYDWGTLGAAICLSAVVDGNAYIRKVRSTMGRVVELWWIPHDLIEPCWDQDGTQYLGWYEYTVNGRVEKIPVADIIHYRSGIDPRNDRKGFSEVKQTVRAVVGLNECDTYTAAILRNLGMPAVVISADSPNVTMTPDDIATAKEQWRENYTGESRGDPLFTPVPMKVTPLSLSPEQLRLDKLPARLEDQICAAIGLSPMVLGLSSGAQHKTYANYGEARRAAYEDCLIPFQKGIGRCLTRQLLLADFESEKTYRFRFNYAGIQCLAENETEVANRVGKLYSESRVIRRSEARQILGYDWDESDEVYADQPPQAGPDEPESASGDGPAETPAAAPSPAAAAATAAAPGPAGDVQAQALNGAQIASLLEVLQAVADGGLPKAAAKAVLTAALPELPPATIDAMVDPIEITAPEPQPNPPGPPPQPAADPAEEARSAGSWQRLDRILRSLEVTLGTSDDADAEPDSGDGGPDPADPGPDTVGD